MRWGLGLIAALSFSVIAASANATVIYSLTGTVGDSHWGGGPGRYVLSPYITMPGATPPAFNGSYGTFSTQPTHYYFTFSTSADLLFSDPTDDLFFDGGELVVFASGGYAQFSAYGGAGLDGGGDVDAKVNVTQHTSSFRLTDSATSTYIDEGYGTGIPVDDTFGDTPLTGEFVNYDTVTGITDVNWLIGVDGKGGEPFSLTVFASVPEPKTWALMIFGIAAIGAGLRSARRRSVAA